MTDAPDDPAVAAAYHPARAVVDLDAIAANVGVLTGYAGGAAVMAVVKADAYGHGLVPAARAALAGGATWLGTAQVGEALALRAAGVTAPRLLTWLYDPAVPMDALLAADVDVTVAAPWALDAVVDAARRTGRTARVHIKVDTGLGRNGLPPADLHALLPALAAAHAEGALELIGVWSHLAAADEPGNPLAHAQAAVLDDAVRALEAAGLPPQVRHLANSAALLTDPRLRYDLVRPGIAVYGLTPAVSLGTSDRWGLTPAMTLEARLATVKHLPAGHGISYGHAYVTPADTTVAVVPLGYADGIPRHASGTADRPGGPVGVNGRVVPVAGRVCMDQVVLDLGPGATERAGDVVEVFGTGRDGGPTAEDWAQRAGTIGYEIVTRVGSRIPRVHVGTAGRAGGPEATEGTDG
ncbi:alanine racemase [Cellulomonas marina]|uniref:Alanine racemase n=1 Tax=Cellulomonas marina TaxID=988821 RepID=A0A1I0XR03_9CELL|nr:alanine racemase [Cellulomonas marina]GIG30040.1 alanine racemase [Cellulomonas marina]SFB03087.1 alanine racemase [Cellulomonas marina]